MATTPLVTGNKMTRDTYHDDDEEGKEGESSAVVHDQQSRTAFALLQTFYLTKTIDHNAGPH
jgi:hypothetical protein